MQTTTYSDRTRAGAEILVRAMQSEVASFASVIEEMQTNIAIASQAPDDPLKVYQAFMRFMGQTEKLGAHLSGPGNILHPAMTLAHNMGDDVGREG